MTPRALPRNPNLKLITPNPRLADAQHMIAREYGYASWRELKQHVDAVARDSDNLQEVLGL